MNERHRIKATNNRLPSIILGTIIAAPHTLFAAVDVATHPLIVAEPVPPNLFYILDDSGSMNRDDIPDSTGCSGGAGGDSNNVILFSTGKLSNNASDRCQSPDFNKLYYNPNLSYPAPVNDKGISLGESSFTSAWRNGYLTGTARTNTSNLTDLSQWSTEIIWTYGTYSSGYVCRTRTGSPPNYTYSNCGDATSKKKITGYLRGASSTELPFHYYRLIAGRALNSTTDSDYEKVTANANEYTNIANWYSYYRTRLFTARAGTSLAFSSIPSTFRVGYGSINYPYNSNYSTIVSGVRNYSSLKTSFYNWLFNVTPATSTYYFTPLRRALDNVGKYFETPEPWQEDPTNSSSKEISCRPSFSILMTDGYWTDGSNYQATTASATANNDGTNGETITGTNNKSYSYSAAPPFNDSWSNTLADVAMHYWKRDLRPSLTNNLPTSESDPAFWQHMVTIGIGMGVDGTINRQTAFDAIQTSSSINWPNPTADDVNKVDDLLHAAIDSRGVYYSARTSQEFTEGLKQSVATIQSRLAATSNLAIDGATLAEGATIFKASFRSVVWSGELTAYTLNPDGTMPASANWLASAQIPDPSSRSIYTRSNGVPTTFTWSNLSSGQKASLKSESVLDYLRGDQSKESSNGGTYRTRPNIIGDIVNSSPAYVGAPDPYLFKSRSFPGASSHTIYAQTQANRNKMVYVGSNDGMLHGFNANTGAEVFSYIPETVVNPTFATLSSQDYNHQYFTDGELTASDVYTVNGWKTILVGSLGRGGRSIFGLDVTNPTSISPSSMLWETSIAAMGQSIGKPVIGRLQNGTWAAAYGNGYNSLNNQADLILVNIENGTASSIGTSVGSTGNPNGLAAPYLWDANNDGSFDTAYAGDLQGNIWKFDLTKNTATKIFQATDPNGNSQPITAGVRASKNPETGRTWIFFGTGKFLGDSDPSSRQVQTWYGLIDENKPISSRNQLLQRNILADTSVGPNSGRTISSGSSADLSGKSGWFIDLYTGGTNQGERMVLPNQLLGSISLIGVTLIPVGDECNPGGTGYIMAIDPFTGSRLGFSFFDFSGDGIISPSDQINGADASGVNFGNIPSNPVFKGDKMIVQTDQGQVVSLSVNPPYPAGETQRAGWLELSDD